MNSYWPVFPFDFAGQAMDTRPLLLALWLSALGLFVIFAHVAEGNLLDPKKVVLVDYTPSSSGIQNFLFRWVRSSNSLLVVCLAKHPLALLPQKV